MLEEARARLANTHGKKAKRKECEKILHNYNYGLSIYHQLTKIKHGLLYTLIILCLYFSN